MSKTLRNLLMLLLCLTLFACLAPAAFADGSTVADLQAAIDNRDASFTLTGNMTISADIGNNVIDARGIDVTIPSGTTLTVSGSGNYKGGIELGTLDLGGTVVVNSGGIFRVNNELKVSEGAQVQANGGFNLFPAADILPNNASIISGTGETSLLFTPTDDDSFASAVTAINGLANNFVADVNVNAALTLSSEHTFTHKTELRVNGGKGGSLTLAQGAELKYDKCGGNVFLDSNGEADCGTVCANNGKMIVNNISLASGCTFASSGTVETGNLDLGGTVQVNGGIFRVNEELGLSGGTVEVNSGFNLFPAADILPDNTGVIEHKTATAVTNLLYKPTDDDSFAAAVASANGLADDFVADINIFTPVELTDEYTFTHKTELRVNSAKGGSLTLDEGALIKYDECGGNVFFMNGGSKESRLLCTNNGAMFVNNIDLQAYCEFTSSGTVELNNLNLGGLLTLNGGMFRVNNKLERSGGTVEVYGGFNSFPAADILPDHTDVIEHKTDDADTNLLFTPTDNASFASAVSAINDLEEDRFVGNIGIFDNLALTGQHTLRHKTFIYVHSGKGGSLGVAPGALLKYDRCGGSISFENNGEANPAGVSGVAGELYVNDISIKSGCKLAVAQSGKVSTGNASVAGTLENDGFFVLRARGGSNPYPCMSVSGAYRGGGAVGVMDLNDPDSYFSGLNLSAFKKAADNGGTRYLPADIILPAGLTAIESSALPDGRFSSVFVPAGVSSIEDDAFGDKTGLLFFGANSYAKTFADRNDFSFISVAW